ncbi:fumarylacetoacetate hydrolase family protein [Antarcticimicrobium sediminis]|uniref:FAA hydrolase family protein n=1 Tax=Antarcticimicrobium sediminis TaxID=2546227 RepID=A0A4R5EY53_9RHOB|nr:fumarylacetoacetate hydrolase family protein [Antarcticimicrobium sediminis]TDE39740.1 FAA hydrolase family protein [Antarcticimicrobium sediminis]
MTQYLFEPPKVKSVPVKGEAAQYPVGRIFCVGRNYAAHAIEMGGEPDREAPFYFTKSPQAALASGETLPYPPGTENFHYEMELVLVIGAPVFRANAEQAAAAIYGYGCGLDMTRRDLQQVGKDKRRPWDLGKDVEGSAVFAPLSKAADLGEIGPQRIHLEVNGVVKQDAHLHELIHSVGAVVADLSKYYHLMPGDLIMTGTPAGVGPVVAGDVITGGIDGLDPIALKIGPAD